MKEHVVSILKGAAIAGIGALLSYAGPALMQLSYVVHIHGSVYDLTPVVVAALSVVVNIVRKLLGL